MKYTPKLLDTILKQEFETNHVDFKRGFNWHTFKDYHKTKFAKHLAAMSNIPGGGMLIFGVADNKEVCGVSELDIRSFDRTPVDHYISQYIDPLPQYHVMNVEYRGVQLLIIEVDEFAEIPCICKHEYEGVLRAGGVYIRHNASSMLVQRASQMRVLIDLAVTKKKDELLTSIEEILDHKPDGDANWGL